MAKEATLKIGNSNFEHLGKAIAAFAEAIDSIFVSGNTNRMEQETIRTAIRAFEEIAKVENVAVTSSVFKGDKTLNVNMDEKEVKNEQ
jgi:hypothetical protein